MYKCNDASTRFFQKCACIYVFFILNINWCECICLCHYNYIHFVFIFCVHTCTIGRTFPVKEIVNEKKLTIITPSLQLARASLIPTGFWHPSGMGVLYIWRRSIAAATRRTAWPGTDPARLQLEVKDIH